MKRERLVYYLKDVSFGLICDNACRSQVENKTPSPTKQPKKMKERCREASSINVSVSKLRLDKLIVFCITLSAALVYMSSHMC